MDRGYQTWLEPCYMNLIMTQSEFETRLQRLERRNRIGNFGLAGCAIIAVVALLTAVRALMPVLRVQSALRAAFTASAPSSSPVIGHESAHAASTTASIPAPVDKPQQNNLLSVIVLKVTGKRTLPKDPEAGRYNAEAAFTFVGGNPSDRNIRAYQGIMEIQDLLGNTIIRLQVQHQESLASHHSQQFTDDFEVNPFINSNVRMASEPFANLAFKWEPTKIVFSDGTSMEVQQ